MGSHNKVISEEELDELCRYPRVTLDHVIEASKNVSYVRNVKGTEQERLVTYAQVTMPNGYLVTGISVCADPRNFNEEIGKRAALGDAHRQVWRLLAYDLRNELSKKEKPVEERIKLELSELVTKKESLIEFLGSNTFTNIPERQKELLLEQRAIMEDYVECLQKRLLNIQANA